MTRKHVFDIRDLHAVKSAFKRRYALGGIAIRNIGTFVGPDLFRSRFARLLTEHLEVLFSQLSLCRGLLSSSLGSRPFRLQGGLDLRVPWQLNPLATLRLTGPQNLPIEIPQHFLNQQLGLGARNEDAGLTRNGDGPKTGFPNDVLQRLSLCAAHDGTVHGRELLSGHGFIEAHVNLRAGQPRHPRKQPFRGKARPLIALIPQVVARPIQASLDSPGFVGHTASIPRVAHPRFYGTPYRQPR